MKGLLPLFLGLFGTFAFSWIGLTVVPNYQIGHLDPQMDEEGTDVYPVPRSGMADRGDKVYTGNGCFYCHSEWVRPEYAGSDIDRKWGERRSAPRDYIFQRPSLLGKMRMGPDLSNLGKRAPAEDENAPPAGASPAASGSPAGSPTTASASPSPTGSPSQSPSAKPTSPAGSPSAAAAASPSPTGSPSQSPSAASSPVPSSSPARSTSSPAATGSPTSSPSTAKSNAAPMAPVASASPAKSPSAATASASPAASAMPAASPAGSLESAPASGELLPYSAAWHHQHLYSPRSIMVDSNMPAYRFLYEKRRISGERSADALKLTGRDTPPEGWEIVPTYDAKCLVAYLMSLDQSHPLKEVKFAAPASPAPAPAAASPSPK